MQREFCNLPAENFDLLTKRRLSVWIHWLRRKGWRIRVYHRANRFI